MKYKQLKQTTLRSYDRTQLLNHISRYLENFHNPPYRILPGAIFEYCPHAHAYFFHCSTHNKHNLLEVIEDLYTKKTN